VKVSGNATLNATPEQVWAALNDPAVLVRTIPGCEQLETVGQDKYRMRVTAGVASIKGTYLGDVELADHVPYSAFTLKASGSGAPGTVSADVKVSLDGRPDGTTVLSYDADAVVGGTVGGVGQRVLGGVARKLAGEFFTAVNGQLGEPTGSGSPEAAGVAPVVPLSSTVGPAQADGASPAAESSSSPTVFTRPAPPAGAGRSVQVDVRNTLPAVALGAAIALIGVVLGWRLGRRSH
jgi:carbon monoxide dehydrogenase subunit G